MNNVPELIEFARDTKLSGVTYPLSLLGMMKARNHISEHNLPVDTLVLSESIRRAFFEDGELSRALEIEPEAENVKKGVIGVLYGMTVLEDPEQKLEEGSITVLSTYHLKMDPPKHPREHCAFKCLLSREMKTLNS